MSFARRLAAYALFVPTLAFNLIMVYVLRVWHWWDRVDEHVWIGALPFPAHARALYALGVRAVVNLCRECPGPVRTYAKLGMEQLHIPTVDYTPPQLADVERAVQFISRHVARGEAVYVHCKAGRQRSATVVVAWLIESQSLSPEKALDVIVQVRPHVNRRVAERAAVRAFWTARSGADRGPTNGQTTDS